MISQVFTKKTYAIFINTAVFWFIYVFIQNTMNGKRRLTSKLIVFFSTHLTVWRIPTVSFFVFQEQLLEKWRHSVSVNGYHIWQFIAESNFYYYCYWKRILGQWYRRDSSLTHVGPSVGDRDCEKEVTLVYNHYWRNSENFCYAGNFGAFLYVKNEGEFFIHGVNYFRSEFLVVS